MLDTELPQGRERQQIVLSREARDALHRLAFLYDTRISYIVESMLIKYGPALIREAEKRRQEEGKPV